MSKIQTKKKMRLIPAGGAGLSEADEATIYRSLFRLRIKDIRTLRKLREYGKLYVTDGAIAPCEYYVVVRYGYRVPYQYDMGVELCMILVKRLDEKTEPYYWEDLQNIKDLVIGKDCEAIELYPASWRRLRRFRFRVLWGIVSGEQVPIGWPRQKRKQG